MCEYSRRTKGIDIWQHAHTHIGIQSKTEPTEHPPCRHVCYSFGSNPIIRTFDMNSSCLLSCSHTCFAFEYWTSISRRYVAYSFFFVFRNCSSFCRMWIRIGKLYYVYHSVAFVSLSYECVDLSKCLSICVRYSHE